MQDTTEVTSLTTKPFAPRPAEIPQPELGHSLLALIHTHSDSPSEAQAESIVQHLDQIATGLEQTATVREQSLDAAHTHSLRMAEMYDNISQLLNLLHDRLLAEPPLAFHPDHLQPLATSMNTAFEAIQQRISDSEERQCQALETTLKQWEIERESRGAEHMLHVETIQLQTQMEVNRLLRVMWLGTGLAAAGAGLALFLSNN